VSATVACRTLKDAVVIPDDAVQHGANGLCHAVADGNKAEVRKIKVGSSTNGKTLADHINVGERVVTRGQYRVQPGAALTVNAASSDQATAKAD
jgi:multidrug efflux system membrane fusion protein